MKFNSSYNLSHHIFLIKLWRVLCVQVFNSKILIFPDFNKTILINTNHFIIDMKGISIFIFELMKTFKWAMDKVGGLLGWDIDSIIESKRNVLGNNIIDFFWSLPIKELIFFFEIMDWDKMIGGVVFPILIDLNFLIEIFIDRNLNLREFSKCSSFISYNILIPSEVFILFLSNDPLIELIWFCV